MMNFYEFDWDEANISHIAAHGVTPDEVEEILRNNPYDLDLEIRNHEERILQIGQTQTGRILVVVTTMRAHKIRVVTSFPASRIRQQLYLNALRGNIQ